MPHFDIDNQQPYWNRVADQKTFTHPMDLGLLQRLCGHEALVLDFGCGCGRLVTTLKAAGYSRAIGYDTSQNLIRRGQDAEETAIHHIASPADLPVPEGSIDAILLFAVLTCIPSNAGQQALVALLKSKLKPGGILYVSDYYLQPDRLAAQGYRCLHDDPSNEGVFTLAEGVTFRHHARDWIAQLFQGMDVLHHAELPVHTMNGHLSSAFQMVLGKPRGAVQG